MSEETKPNLPPKAPQRSGLGELWRALLAASILFLMPVAARPGLMVSGALALRLLSLGVERPAPRLGISTGRGPAVAVIRVEGMITSGEADTFSTSAVASADTLVKEIQEAEDDGDVKAI